MPVTYDECPTCGSTAECFPCAICRKIICGECAVSFGEEDVCEKCCDRSEYTERIGDNYEN